MGWESDLEIHSWFQLLFDSAWIERAAQEEREIRGDMNGKFEGK